MMDLAYILSKSIRDVVQRKKYAYVPFLMKLDGDEEHLRETMQWLMRGVDHGEGGVSSHYSLLHGRWLSPFPETTGYIIPTLYDYAAHTGDDHYADTAHRLTDWLGEALLDSGACMRGLYDRSKGKNNPIIFNTGQNIFGFLRTYRETGDPAYLAAARRAGDFLVASVDGEGIWNQALHHGIPHTYNSRSSWALLELFNVTQHEPYRQVALSNLDWVVAQQTESGWFHRANFKPNELPNTHGLAYTTRGLVESYRLTRDDRYLHAAKKTADKFLRLFEIRKMIYTFWDSTWKNHGKYFSNMRGPYICVTGNIQLSLVWMKLYEITGDATYVSSAFKMIDFVKALQDVTSRRGGVRGGVPGAFPIFGSYSVLKFPNWAAKFWADALMMKHALMHDERISQGNIQQQRSIHDENSRLASISQGGAKRVEASTR